MMASKIKVILLWSIAALLGYSVNTDAAECTSDLSVAAGCTECTDWGYCEQGTVPVTDWLKNALMTQRELQVDFTFDQFIMLDSHNSFQARAYGLRYGANDTCVWPPPYPENCTSIGNHEFTIIDQLNLGVRGIEIDNWWCYDAMRVCHLGTHEYLGVCEEDHMLFSDLLDDIGAWLDEPENQNEIIRLYINEKDDQGHDDVVNGAIAAAFGDRVLTPSDLSGTYGGQWPTIKRMREDGKHVFMAVSGVDGHYYTHGDVYLYPLYFDGDFKTRLFDGYPACNGRNDTNIVRFYSDTLNFPLVETGYYSGEDTVGSIKDLTEFARCRIQYPAMDMINHELMETAVFTWAQGEPSADLTHESCIMLKGSDHRWYAATDCTESYHFACQSDTNPEDWTASTQTGPYSTTEDVCPQGFSFSVPHNGYRQQQLIESSGSNDVWLNFSPWLESAPTSEPTVPMTTASAARFAPMSSFLCLVALVSVAVTF